MPEIDIETAIIGAGQAGVRLARALAADGRGVALGIRVRQVEVDFPGSNGSGPKAGDTRSGPLCNQSTMRNLARESARTQPTGPLVRIRLLLGDHVADVHRRHRQCRLVTPCA